MRISDTADDVLLENSIDAASRLVDGHCARQFFSIGTATREYAAASSYTVDVDDFYGTTITLETADSDYGIYDRVWTSDDYQLEPLNGVLDGQTWSFDRIRAVGDVVFPTYGNGTEVRVRLTAVYGWASIPKPIEQATIIQASRIFKRYDSPLGVAGFGEFGAMRVSSRLDPDVAMLCEPFRRMRQFA
jgi:hypothetical protein